MGTARARLARSLPPGVELLLLGPAGVVTQIDAEGLRTLRPSEDFRQFMDEGQYARYLIGEAESGPERPAHATYKLGIVAPHSTFAPHTHGCGHVVLSLGYACCDLYHPTRGETVRVRLPPGSLLRIPGMLPHAFGNRGSDPLLILAANTGLGLDHADYAITAAEADRRARVHYPGTIDYPVLARQLRARGCQWIGSARLAGTARRRAPPPGRGLGAASMICPHCNANLLYKQRGGHRCSRCKRAFALDPKTNRLLLHDRRLRALVARISVDGTLRYTADQLRHAAARKPLRYHQGRIERHVPLSAGRRLLRAALSSALIAIAAIAVAGILGARDVLLAIIGGVVYVVVFAMAMSSPMEAIPMTLEAFRRSVLERWRTVYGEALPGLVDRALSTRVMPSSDQAHAVLVCPDADVLACLAANGVHERLGLGLAPVTRGEAVDWLPSVLVVGAPVLFALHDASAAGCLFAARLRGSLGPPWQVIDLGLAPRTVIAGRTLLRLRDKPPPQEEIDELRATGTVTDDEARWLARGLVSPLAAIPPAKLIKVVEESVLAGGVGFLTWPSGPGASRTHDAERDG